MCDKCKEKHRLFVCECGKEFERLNQMTGHQSKCKVHLKLLEEERNKRRLPNGLFKCENPDCNNEHDGSYGTGRFCSKKCRMHVIGKHSYETKLKNGTFTSAFFNQSNIHNKRRAKGDWKCSTCGKIFRTRAERNSHYREEHYNGQKCVAWNKGLTKTTDIRVKAHSEQVQKTLKEGFKSGRLKIKNYIPKNMDGLSDEEKYKLRLIRYRELCRFTFSLNQFPDEFDFKLIEEHGWYSAKNRGNNMGGVSRDHMYSVKEGFLNNIDPKIISHPANCRLVRQCDNASKRDSCSITLEELLKRIEEWNKKYPLQETNSDV